MSTRSFPTSTLALIVPSTLLKANRSKIQHRQCNFLRTLLKMLRTIHCESLLPCIRLLPGEIFVLHREVNFAVPFAPTSKTEGAMSQMFHAKLFIWPRLKNVFSTLNNRFIINSQVDSNLNWELFPEFTDTLTFKNGVQSWNALKNAETPFINPSIIL